MVSWKEGLVALVLATQGSAAPQTSTLAVETYIEVLGDAVCEEEVKPLVRFFVDRERALELQSYETRWRSRGAGGKGLRFEYREKHYLVRDGHVRSQNLLIEGTASCEEECVSIVDTVRLTADNADASAVDSDLLTVQRPDNFSPCPDYNRDTLFLLVQEYVVSKQPFLSQLALYKESLKK